MNKTLVPAPVPAPSAVQTPLAGRDHAATDARHHDPDPPGARAQAGIPAGAGDAGGDLTGGECAACARTCAVADLNGPGDKCAGLAGDPAAYAPAPVPVQAFGKRQDRRLDIQLGFATG